MGGSGEGHTLRQCKRDGIEAFCAEREKDPKIVQQKEKAKAKREARSKEERERLGITRQKKGLYQPSIKLGFLKEEFKDQCQSVRGAVETATSKAYLEKILKIVNRNQEKYVISLATREAANVDYPEELVIVTDSEDEQGEPRKPTVGSLELRKKTKKIRRRVSGRRVSNLQRKHSQCPLFLQPIDFEELMTFFGILVHAGTEKNDSWRDYWTRNHDSSQHGLIQLAMSFERFSLIFQNFYFSEQEVLFHSFFFDISNVI